MVCNMDCYNCPYEDCINGTLTEADRQQQNEYDALVVFERKSHKERRIYLYNHSDQAKVAQKKYRTSDKGKAAIKSYNQSEKAKETRRRYRQRKKARAAACGA